MATEQRLICASEELVNAGKGVRFDVQWRGQTVPAFVIRFADEVHAYLNRCSHVAMELGWQPGVFFDADGIDLICSTHGALFAAQTGRCVGGPCAGGPLVKLEVVERDGAVFLKEDLHV